MGRAEDAIRSRHAFAAQQRVMAEQRHNKSLKRAKEAFRKRREQLATQIRGEVEALVLRLNQSNWAKGSLLEVREPKWKFLGYTRYKTSEVAAYKVVASFGGDFDDWPTRQPFFVTPDKKIRYNNGQEVDLLTHPFSTYWNADPVEALLRELVRLRES